MILLLNVNIKLNTEVTGEMLANEQADEVIIATGAKPKNIPIPGVDKGHVIEAIDYLLGDRTLGSEIAVVGGGLTGCEIAYDLAKAGKQVTVIEMMDDILQVPGLSAANSNMLRELFRYYSVDLLTSAKVCQIADTGVVVSVGDCQEKVIKADNVIMAVGYDSGAQLADEVKEKNSIHIIGDAAKVGNLMDVVWAAYDVAFAI